ncbi:hypothetical protein ASPWEDRAFT_166268 [Aspergillus wentii DTO 134E9]|uniref:DUF614 domain protein n=1 Tax=Aspergillus wentii DTO 134E9 TaxID=1073089 RepID=A0A1L9RZ55_ASPWE|nr:uncharacterized protein ASPWEDRAFT_166268 [Aspergillus wentii DTO 134E9]KAI9932614.1 hypothetical protein MW887_008861 [Aspergillus wentii]OJJ40183.1 hypothetical protein ASPWEDRAFT_166268 [Aspergillus wentii DTO 134E9]
MSEEWHNGFWSCSSCGLCCESCCCPCMVFGRTHERNNGVQDPSSCNGQCMGFAFCCSIGLHSLCLCLERRSIRKQYNIKGGCCGDFWGSMCCHTNVLMQAERESLVRNTPQVTQQYKSVGGMSYAPRS